jgi:hypothetical protein
MEHRHRFRGQRFWRTQQGVKRIPGYLPVDPGWLLRLKLGSYPAIWHVLRLEFGLVLPLVLILSAIHGTGD